MDVSVISLSFPHVFEKYAVIRKST